MHCFSCPVVKIGTDLLPLTAMVELPGISAHMAVSSMLPIQCCGK